MQVSKEELLHIANLADLEISQSEIDKYLLNLQDILNFANIVNQAPVQDLDITIGANEIEVFEDNEALLQNAPDKELNMFKIPKVIN